MPLCTVSFHKKMWFLTLQIKINATSLEQLCKHEYVLSCQVERTPLLTSGRVECSACRRANLSRSLHIRTHTHTPRCHLLPRCTHNQNHHHHRFLFFWSSGLAPQTACKLLLLPMKRYNPGSSVHHRHPLLPPPPPHICVVSARARDLQPSLNEVTRYVPTGRGPGCTARTARRSLMRRLESPSIRAGIR